MIAIELTGAIDAAGSVRTFYLTDQTGGFATTPTDTPANQAFMPRIIDAGRIGLNAFSDGRTGGGTKLEIGEISIANIDGALDAWINYSFDGRAVVIRTGSAAAAYPSGFQTILSGTVESLEASFDRIVIRLRDKQFVFDKPALTTRYAGSNALPGGLEGVANDLKGKTKPRAFGKVFNVAPPCVNTSRLIYELGPIQSADAAYDRGLLLTAGAAYASQADMEATAPAAGQYRVWNPGGGASAFARFGSTPTGLVTFDLTEGATAGDRAAAQILKRLALLAVSSGEISAADVTSLDTLNSAVVGVWVEGEMKVREAMDKIAASIGAFYAFDSTGLLRMGRLSAPSGTAVVSIGPDDYKKGIARRAPRDNGMPVWRAVLRYSRLWTVQPSDIAGAVAADRRAYLAAETRTEIASDAAVKTQWLLAVEAEFETLLTSSSDAATEVARLLALYKVRRDIFDVPVRIDIVSKNGLRLMDVVELRCARFGMSSGRLFRIIGIRIELGNKQAILSLWG